MSVLRYIERVKYMHFLIEHNATGCPLQFANKLGISRSALMEYLKELREINAPIAYDKNRMTYYYKEPCTLNFGYKIQTLSDDVMAGTTGGCMPYFEFTDDKKSSE